MPHDTKLENRLLAALPPDEYQRLLPYLETISPPHGQVLYRTGEVLDYVYFPHQSIISLVMILEDGATLEVGLVGSEGMAGVHVVLGSDLAPQNDVFQVAGNVTRLAVARLKAELSRGGKLQTLLLLYMQALFMQVSQGAACYRLHTVEERLAR